MQRQGVAAGAAEKKVEEEVVPNVNGLGKWFHPLKTNMGVSKNRGTQKWMVYNGKPR